MPQAAPAIVAAVGAGIAAGSVVKALTVFVVNIALSALSSALTKRPRNPGPPPVTVSVRSTVEHRRLLVGTRRCGGSFVFYYTSGNLPNEPNKWLWYVVAYVDHQCHALRDAWLDEFHVPEADINPTTGVVSTSTFQGADGNPKLWIWSHLGTQAQTADSNLTSTFTGGAQWNQWETTDRMRGVCYRIFKMERDEKSFATGAPDSASSLVDGALLYDPRKDSTNGGSGSHRRDNPSTWEFSRNWALGMRWLLTGGSVVNDQATRLVRYGLREDDSRIDEAYWIAAANIADESLLGGNAPPSGDQPRYRLDLEVSCAQTRREILEQALQAGAGTLVYVHGKWRLYAGAYDAPVHAFTQDDLRGEMEIEDITDEDERVNRVAGVYFDAAQQYGEATTPYRFNAAYDTQDGNRLLQREIELYGVTDAYQAQRICELELRKARQMRRVTFRFGRTGMKVAVNETFSFSHSRYGWTNRVFRCLKKKRERTEDGGIITVITARAEDSAIYTDLATADYTSGTSITNTVQSEQPERPLSLTATSRPYAIDFAWTLGTFWQLNGVTELWEATTDSFGSASKIWEGRGSRVTIARSDSVTRFYWVRVRTIGGQSSATFPATNGVAGKAILAAGTWAVDADGKPAGIRAVEGIANRSQLQFGGIGIQILGSPDNQVAYGFPAIPIDDTATYQLTIRHRSSGVSADSLYLRFNELNAALSTGKTHVGDGSGESISVTRTSLKDLVANGPMPGTSVVENTYTYTPTAGTKFASFTMYNWSPFTGTYEVEWVRLTRTGSNVNLLMTGGPATDTQDILPGAVDTDRLDQEAATEVYQATAAGPLTYSVSPGGLGHIAQVLYVTLPIFEASWTVEVSAQFRVDASGTGYTVKAGAMRGDFAANLDFSGPTTEKTTPGFENQAVVGTFTQSPATYNFGIGLELVADGINACSATFRDMDIRVTLVKR